MRFMISTQSKKLDLDVVKVFYKVEFLLVEQNGNICNLRLYVSNRGNGSILVGKTLRMFNQIPKFMVDVF